MLRTKASLHTEVHRVFGKMARHILLALVMDRREWSATCSRDFNILEENTCQYLLLVGQDEWSRNNSEEEITLPTPEIELRSSEL